MCHTTKDRIVLALRELMKENPVRKIKIQDIMMKTGMTRQSFYYHFQDVYQVLEWELDRKLLQPLRYQEGRSMETWLHDMSKECARDHEFYRKAIINLYDSQVSVMLSPVIQQNVYHALIDPSQDESNLSEVQAYSIELCTDMIYYQLIRNIKRREVLPDEVSDMRINILVQMMDNLKTNPIQ